MCSPGLCDACIVEELEAKRERLDIANFAWTQVDAEPPIALPLRRYESAVRLEKKRLKRMPVDQSPWQHHVEMERPLPLTESQKARYKNRSDSLFQFFS